MQAVYFKSSYSDDFPLMSYLKKLNDDYEKGNQEAAEEFFLILGTIDASKNYTIESYDSLMKRPNDDLPKQKVPYFSPKTSDVKETGNIKIVKKITGGKNKLKHKIRNSPIFELRINENQIGFRCLFFVTSQNKYGDNFDNFECFLHCFHKQKYSSMKNIISGNYITDKNVKNTFDTYREYQNNLNHFDYIFQNSDYFIKRRE